MKGMHTIILPSRPEKKVLQCLIVCFSFLLSGCVETFEPQTLTFENALVVEASITNEMKEQEIKLSRAFAFEEDGPKPERNADVRVEDNQGSVFAFHEDSPGIYHSETVFAAQQGRTYQLLVNTGNGGSYKSLPAELAPAATINEVYAERMTNGDGVEGMAIRVNASSPSGNARNYRYEFDETYKIIAPKWAPKKLIPDPDDRCGVLVVTRDEEQHTCYATRPSNGIIITNTNSFPEDRVKDFIVRFIKRDNYIISHRYSILVRQLVESSQAYTFYETLNDFSGSQSLFSGTQPGLLQGNMFSANNPDEHVLGYFEVASVTSKRLFFNYDDFFPGEPLPPYVNRCIEIAPAIYGATSGPVEEPSCVLKPLVELNTISYVDENKDGVVGDGGPYIVVPRECGDCTALGSAEVPDFWIE